MEDDAIKVRIAAVLDSWYGDSDRDKAPTKENLNRWYQTNAEFDQMLTEKHMQDFEAIAADEGASWCKHEDGVVAVILLCDQISRNVFRKQAKAFEFDHISLKLVKQLRESGDWKKYKHIDQLFFSMPFQHSEVLEDVKESINLLQEMSEEVKDDEDKARVLKFSISYAQKHHDIVEKYDRYPHRNEALGRENTPEEIEYLNNADRFGQ
mmetsp:Transcript_30146/g.34503  ORF Transcript_30146/g.34503 Transcript_30146/m.34503 type:complete len:209 (-) Transcript_30146:51-677(-)